MAITSMNQLIVGMFNAPAGNLLAGLEFVYGDDFESAAADLASAAAFPYASVNDMVAAMLGDSVDADTLAAADAWADTQTDMAAAALVAVDFLLTTEDEAFANARAQFENKVTVAVHYSTGANMVTFTDVATSQALIASVTSDAASVTAITEAAPAPVEGSTFTLTTGTDNIFGTDGDDTITATSSTFTGADVIADSSSDDNDTLTITATDDISATPTLVNIENVNVNVEAFAAAGVANAAAIDMDAANISGATISFDVTQTGSSLAQANITNLKTGNTISVSDDFTGVLVTSVDNASYTVNAADDISVTDAGATADDVTINGEGTVTVGAGNAFAADGDLTITAAKDITITNADSATGLTATSTGGSISVTTADGATSMSLTAADEVTVTGATGAKTVTVSAAGTGATGSGTTVSTVTATAMTALNVSGNGAAVKVDASESDALKTITASGEQNIEVVVDADELKDITAFTFTDNTTAGTTTLTVDADAGANTVDLQKAAADVIKLITAQNAAADYDVASGANVTNGADQTNLNFDGKTSTKLTNTMTLNIDDDDAANTTGDITTKLDFDNFASVTINVNDVDETSGGVDLAEIDAGTATVTLAGVSDLDIDKVTAASLDASGVSGKVALDLVGVATVATVTTGSGADTVTQTTGDLTTGGYTINTGAGKDTVVLLAAADSTVDGGDDSDTVKFDGDYSSRTISLTNVEVLDMDSDGTAGNMKVKGSLLDGGSYIVKDSSNGDEDINIVMDAASVDLSGLTVDTSTVKALVVDGSTTGAVLGLTITGSSAAEEVTAGAQSDAISTGSGNDTVVDAGAGDDVINLGAGNDTLTDGGTGNDTVDGGAGNDAITAGVGADTVTGGAGDDTFTIATGDSTEAKMDVITDFEANAAASDNDNIVLDGSTNANAGGTLTIISDIASGAGVDVKAADEAAAATDIDAIVTDGMITLEGDDKASIDTLAEWIDVAEKVLYSEESNATKVDSLELAVGFEFDGSTYIVTVLDDVNADEANFDGAADDVIKLEGLTDVTIALTAAANTVVIG
jgi:hypothetical protein